MITVYDEKGQPVRLEPAEAERRFREGSVQFRGGTRIPVRRQDGTLGTVAAESLSEALSAGGFALASEDELAEADARARASEEPGLAAAEGVLRGATAGMSDVAASSDDPIIRAAVRAPLIATGLDDGSTVVQPERLREEIQLREEENPIAATAGEVGGVVTTAVVPGAVAGRVGSQAARAATGISGLGEAAEQVVARGATSGLRRTAGVATGGAVEGALEEMGQAAGQAALRDEELTGEAIAAAAGRGAVFGFAGGAIVGTVAEGARPVVAGLRRAVDRSAIDTRLGELAVGSLNPTAGQIGRLAGRNIDVADVGNMLLDEGLISPRLGRQELVERIDGVLDGDVGPRIGSMLDELDARAPFDVRVDSRQLADRVRRVFEEFEGPMQPAFVHRLRAQIEEAVGAPSTLDEFIEPEQRAMLDFFDQLDVESAAESAARRAKRETADTIVTPTPRGARTGERPAPRGAGTGPATPAAGGTRAGRRGKKPKGREPTPEELSRESSEIEADLLRTDAPMSERQRELLLARLDEIDPDAALRVREAFVAREAQFADDVVDAGRRGRDAQRQRILDDARSRADQAGRIGFRDLHQLRRALDKEIFGNRFGHLEQLSPRQQALHEVRRAINEELQSAMRRADRAASSDAALRGTLEQWQDANRRYQGLVWAREVARRSHAREIARDLNEPLLDVGIAPALALVTGNPGLLVVGWLGGLVNRWMRNNGKALAAAGGRAITQRLGLSTAAASARRNMDNTAASLLTRARRSTRVPSSTKGRILGRALFEERVEEARALSEDASAYDVATEGQIAVHEVAGASFGAAVAYAGAKIRAAQAIKKRMPAGRPELMSDSERARFMRFSEAALRPAGVLQLAKSGELTFDHVDAIREVYPRMYAELVSSLSRRIEEQRQANRQPPYQLRVRIGLLFPELAQEPSMQPDSIRRSQEPNLEREGGALGGTISQGPNAAPQPTPSLDQAQLTRTQQIAEG